mmetsp:Transcript_23872/g.34321  ORF Transcript_23872/g.34321 Transcript_23872/m.34321 type:complete len:215 (+) Transcript_23872:76-720(+)
MNSKRVQDLVAKAEPEHLETTVFGSREQDNPAKEEKLLEEKHKWRTAEECNPRRIQPAQPAEVSLEQKQASEPEAASPSKELESKSGNTAEGADGLAGKRKNAKQKRETDNVRLVSKLQSPKSKPLSKGARATNKPVPEKADTDAAIKKARNVKITEAVSTKPVASKRPPRERKRSSKFGGDEWESDLDKVLRRRSTASPEKLLTETPAVLTEF